MTSTRTIALSAALVALVISAGAPALAAPHGVGNPNQTVGKPLRPGDTDRGHSEAKGRNDLHPAKLFGTVTSVRGSNVVVLMPNGTTRTIFVNRPAFVVGQDVTIVNGSRVTLTPEDETFHGVVTNVTRDVVTFRLPNGKVRHIVVAPESAAHFRSRIGTSVIVVSHDGGLHGILR